MTLRVTLLRQRSIFNRAETNSLILCARSREKRSTRPSCLQLALSLNRPNGTMHFLPAVQLPPVQRTASQRDPRRTSKGLPAWSCLSFSVPPLEIAIAAGINYHPDRTCLPSLIVLGVVNLLLDLSRARARPLEPRFPAGRMTRRRCREIAGRLPNFAHPKINRVL